MKNIAEQIILISISIIIGILFGLGFSDWGKIDTGSVTNWIIALGTIALVLIAILSALSWKAQRIPEARKDFINAIVDFDNHIFLFNSKARAIQESMQNLIDYKNILLQKLWRIESSIMYIYQFDDSSKAKINKKYTEILQEINEFIDFATQFNHYESDQQIKQILPISHELLCLVVGKSLTVQGK